MEINGGLYMLMRQYSRRNQVFLYDAAIKKLSKELDQVIDSSFSIPVQPGGWWHQYVCPTHHTELLFDPLIDDANTFYCPYGCKFSDEPYRGAWLVFKHQSMARYALQASAVYEATGNERFGDLGKRLIVQYAEQFPRYPINPDAMPWMLKGRAFHQALTEAIWATTIIRAYLKLLDQGVSFAEHSDVIDQFLNMLGSSLEEYHKILTVDRDEVENNYTAWLNAGLCCVYAAMKDKNKLEQLVYANGGLKDHLSSAILEDGFEFEGSIYYHLFVLRAYMISAEMLERFSIDGYALEGENGQTLEKMLRVLVLFTDANGKLLATHDGPYERLPYLREIIEVLEIGYKKYGHSSYLRLLDAAYESSDILGKAANLSEQYGNPALLEMVLFGKEDSELKMNEADSISNEAIDDNGSEEQSWILPASGFARLQHPENPVACFIDFGAHGGNHGHFDKLNLMLFNDKQAVSPDRGTVPYGSEFKKDFYLHTVCHNTVAIGGRSQKAATGECIAFNSNIDSNGPSISVVANEAYDETVLQRHILATDDFIIDWYNVSMQKVNTMDWTFHFCGQILDLSNGWQQPQSPLLGELDGYRYIQAQHIYSEEKFTTTSNKKTMNTVIELSGNADSEELHKFSVSLLLPQNTSLFHVHSPGLTTDPSVKMNGLLARCEVKFASIVAVYRSGSQPCEIELIENNQLLQITIGNIKRHYVYSKDGIREMTR